MSVIVFLSLTPPEQGAEAKGKAPDQSETESSETESSETESSETESSESKPWVTGGIVDAAYSYNSNRPDNHVYRGAYTTPRTNEFTLNLAGAFIERKAGPSGGWNLQLGVHGGAAVTAVYAAEPRPGGEDSQYAGSEVFQHIALANTGAAFASGTRIDLGIFSSPVGIGGLWSNSNWLYSSTWESNWVPYYLSGLRFAQELPADMRLEAWMVSGWQTISDVNLAPSGMLALYWQPEDGPHEGAWLAGHLYSGPETEDLAPESWLLHGSIQGGYDRAPFGVSVVADVGRGGLPSDPQQIGLYYGGAIFSRIALLQHPKAKLDLNLRPEIWGDPDGLTYGRPGTLLAATGGLALRVFDALTFRLEYRYDHSTAQTGSFYVRDRINDADQLANEQHTVFLNLTGYYELAFGRRRSTQATQP